MQYKFATEQLDYSDFASGRVFYSLPGHPAFPVRLASEIFQRCIEHRRTIYGDSTPCTLYDPCCGAAYHLSVLACLHGEHIREVIASDVDQKAVDLAERNLGLLRADGLNQRSRELSEMLAAYGKESHRQALRSAVLLRDRFAVTMESRALATRVFRANVLDPVEISSRIKRDTVDIVFTDVPHGLHSKWHDSDRELPVSPVNSMLDALLEILSASSIVAIASDKRQKVSHQRFQRLEQVQIGKRRVVILRPAGGQ